MSPGTSAPTDLAGPAGRFAAVPAGAVGDHLGGAFTGTDPNGRWSLFVVDDARATPARSGGWWLNITPPPATTTAVTSSEPVDTGEDVTFTATVTSDGNPVTDGTVTFSEGATTTGRRTSP